PPIAVPFEPVTLDEADTRLSHLASAGDGHLADEPAAPKRLRGWTRWALRAGIGIGLLTSAVTQCIVNSLFQGWNWVPIAGSGIALLFLVVFCWLAASFINETWQLVPAGIVVTREWVIPAKNRVRLFTPANSFILIEPDPRKGWNAIVQSPSYRSRSRLTDLEAAALLAAWRSPLPPPTIEQLREVL